MPPGYPAPPRRPRHSPPAASVFPAGRGVRGGNPAGPGGAGWNPPSGVQSGPDLSFLSGLGNLDPKAIASPLPVLRELGGTQDSNARQLLFALRPYLKPERQEKVERALQLARLFRVGKKFLLKGMAMYNRYIRTDDGTYTKVSEEETPSGQPRQEPRQDSPPPDGSAAPFGGGEGIAGYLRRILDQLHLDRIDAGGSPASGTAVLPVPGEGGRGTAGGAGPAVDLMRQPDASGCLVLFLSHMIYNRFFR